MELVQVNTLKIVLHTTLSKLKKHQSLLFCCGLGAEVETVIGMETKKGIGVMIDIEGVTETENDEKNGVVKAEKNAGGVEVNQKNARKVDPQKEKEDREVTAKAP